jgi:hypothetical protein
VKDHMDFLLPPWYVISQWKSSNFITNYVCNVLDPSA